MSGNTRSKSLLIRIVHLVAMCLLPLLSHCGGGTSGTGLEKTFEGSVKLPDDQPVVGAQVTIEQTGDSATTDARGDFVIASSQPEGPLSLKIEGRGIVAVVQLKGVADDASHVSVDITVDPVTSAAAASQFEMQSAMVGRCARYFENRGDSILQRRRLPQGISCTMKSIVKTDGTPRGHIVVAVQRKGCAESSEWKTVASGTTDNTVHRGIVQITFPFYDNARACRYRFVAPVGSRRFHPVFVPLETTTSQNHSAKGAP